MFVIKILSKIINARITLIKILFLRFLKGSLKKKLFRTKFSKINSNFIANYRDYHFLEESLKYYKIIKSSKYFDILTSLSILYFIMKILQQITEDDSRINNSFFYNFKNIVEILCTERKKKEHQILEEITFIPVKVFYQSKNRSC